jgi:acyl-CoA synthetase (AMP-forming)/AMP-acid ligase II
VGILDERGRLRVVGRTDDMILSGGENVHPNDVEGDLRRIPGVRDVLVAGVDDAIWGKIVGALLVLHEGCSLKDVELRARNIMAAQKRPRLFCEVSRIPEGRTGKPDRASASELLGGLASRGRLST